MLSQRKSAVLDVDAHNIPTGDYAMFSSDPDQPSALALFKYLIKLIINPLIVNLIWNNKQQPNNGQLERFFCIYVHNVYIFYLYLYFGMDKFFVFNLSLQFSV